MATRIYKIAPGENQYGVAEGVGSAVATDAIELTIDLSTTAVGGTRQLTKDEAVMAIDAIRNYIIQNIWPPA